MWRLIALMRVGLLNWNSCVILWSVLCKPWTIKYICILEQNLSSNIDFKYLEFFLNKNQWEHSQLDLMVIE